MTALISASKMKEQCRQVIYSAFASHCAGLLQLTVLRRAGRPQSRRGLCCRWGEIFSSRHSSEQRGGAWLLRDARDADAERRGEKEGEEGVEEGSLASLCCAGQGSSGNGR